MSKRPGQVLIMLAVGIVVCTVLHVFIGTSSSLTFRTVIHELFRGPRSDTDPYNSIIWDIRMPRAMEFLLVGGLLGSVGSVFQALLRNPLADPYIVGVSSG